MIHVSVTIPDKKKKKKKSENKENKKLQMHEICTLST